MSPHGSPAPGDHGVVEPKHKVFLSHSGAQKGFVRQLDVDLRRWDIHPFFDKDRDCLSIGKKFPERIFKAIEECQVGVVILSQEFFTLSHWPMTELVAMVNQGRKTIMPIFLGISPADLSSGENLERWRSQWHKWAESSERVKLSQWDDAVKSLKGLNGLVYDHAAGVVEFRKEIVKEIRKIVRPSYRWDDSHVQGRSRLSQSLQEKISKTTARSSGVQVVGLYGVGGIGKTTACKSLCKDLFSEFDGRVCHVEFGTGITEKERVESVLLTLTDLDKELLKDMNKLSECWSLLEKNKRSSRVFLAIDNVSGPKSIEEAKKYLKVGCQGSIVMVTTRARGDFKYLGIVDGNCHEVPELDESEAKSLFLYHAEVNFEVDKEVLRQCIKRCYFSKGDGISSHWHPLALKVLGIEMGGDPSEWESKLKEVDVFNQRREVEHGVFNILRWSFDMLGEEDKLLFMDVALFDTGDLDFKNWRKGTFGYDPYKMYCYAPFILDIEETWCLYEWLSVVHNLSVDEVKRRLNILKQKSLLDEVVGAAVDYVRAHPFLGRVGGTQIGMHDLWREFVVTETKKGGMEGGRWVYEVVEGVAKDSSLAGGGWKDLRRICVTIDDDYTYPVRIFSV